MSRPSRVLGLLSFALMVVLAGPSPATAPAKDAPSINPEEFLAADSVLYFRYDGIAAHREAYKQTAFAEMMKGDMGQFVDHCCSAIHKLLPRATEGMTPEQRRLFMGTLPQLFKQVGKHGVVMGVEVSGVLPMPQGQVTLVFPNAAEKAEFNSCFQTLATMAEVKVKESVLSGRTVHCLETPEPIHVAWWTEGKHVVFICGTENVEATLKRVESGKSLARDPRISTHGSYEPMVSTFLDVAGVRRVLADLPIPGMARVCEGLGLNEVQTVAYHCGFEGQSLRSTVSVKTTGERKGLVKLATASAVDLTRLPPVPPDATDIAVFSLDLGAIYDQTYAMAKTIVRMYAPEEWAEIETALKKVNEILGVDLRQDILAQLGPTVVTYNSPSEGMSLLGLGFAMHVKDAVKLQMSLEKACRGLAECAQVDVTIKKSPYHGVDIHTISIAEKGRATGFQCTPSYCMHDGWLVAGLFPHRVQGYVLRATEGYPKWQPSPLMVKTLDELKKNPKVKILAVSEVDPRPAITTILSLAPIGEGILHTVVPDGFDPVMVPNAHNVCKALFPNVSVTVDDGESIRVESYSSLPLPSISGTLVGTYLVAGLMASDFSMPNFAGDFNINLSSPGAPPMTATVVPPAVAADPAFIPASGVFVERIPVAPVQVLPPQFAQPGVPAFPVAGPQPLPRPAPLPQSNPAPGSFGIGLPGRYTPAPTCMPAPTGIPMAMPAPTGVPMAMPAPVQPATYVPGPIPAALPAPLPPKAAPNAPVLSYIAPPVPPPVSAATSTRMMTKVYHVGDLVHQTTGQTWEMAAEMLVRHVQLVEPHSWNSGGAVCGCYAPTETITVRQSLEAHEQIERMLNDMRLHGRKAMYGSTRPSSTVGKP